MVAFHPQSQSEFRSNEVVAIVRRLPWGKDVISITKIRYVGDVLVETIDHHFFATGDGRSVGGRLTSYIEPVTQDHFALFQAKNI